MTWVAFFVSWGVAIVAFLLGAMWAGKRRPHRDWQHSFLTGMMSIFHEGEMARQRGAAFEDNPYFDGTPERRSWAFGWSWTAERCPVPDGSITGGFREPVRPGD